MVNRLEALFPKLRGSSYRVTSEPDYRYNCVAWAAGDSRQWWWPGTSPSDYWPAGVVRAESLSAFQEAFASLGYVPCDRADFEAGFERIALFADAHGFPTHAARQLPNGRWTSKLGELEDIEHSLDDLTGVEYGSVVQIMRRPAALPSGEAGSN